MHRKDRNYWYCIQNNQWQIIGDQLLTESPIKLKDSSIAKIWMRRDSPPQQSIQGRYWSSKTLKIRQRLNSSNRNHVKEHQQEHDNNCCKPAKPELQVGYWKIGPVNISWLRCPVCQPQGWVLVLLGLGTDCSTPASFEGHKSRWHGGIWIFYDNSTLILRLPDGQVHISFSIPS